MPQDSGSVPWDAIAVCQGPRQGGRGLIHDGCQPGWIVAKPLMLDTDRARVVRPVSGMPRDILLSHHLGDVAITGSQQVVSADIAAGVLEPRD